MVSRKGAEVGFKPVTKSGETGVQFCNLVSINGSKADSEDEFYKICKYAAFLGTIQATYNEFPFLNKATNDLALEDPLVGVSIGGVMNNPEILLVPQVLQAGAQILKETNASIAAILGINPSSRLTVIKPKYWGIFL